MTPSLSLALPAQETMRFLERALPAAPARLLEVGCGDGIVAAALAERGYDVTALDETLTLAMPTPVQSAAVRWVECGFVFYAPGPADPAFDAVLFTRSLHHLGALERALDHAASLLRPGGLLVAEEFAFDRVTLPTARWWYDLEAVLVAAGAMRAEHEPDASPTTRNPLGRWREAHAHDPPLATGHAMLAAVRDRFTTGPAEEAPYFYRYVAERASGSPEAARRLVVQVHEIESRLVRERDIAAAGLRMVGTLAS